MAATNNINPPQPNVLSKGPIGIGAGTMIVGTAIWLGLVFDGAPTAAQGAGWADIGSTGVDATSGIWYSNRGTKANPNWVPMSTV